LTSIFYQLFLVCLKPESCDFTVKQAAIMLYTLSPRNSINDLLSALCRDRVVYAIEKQNQALHLVRSIGWDPQKHILGDYRPLEPLKGLVFRPREALGPLMENQAPQVEERIVVGVKNCDLSALAIHDYVFLSDPVDDYYKEQRDKTILISCDCLNPCDVCFCPIVKEQPYAKEGFDINISPTKSGFVIESGSTKGETLLKSAQNMLEGPDEPFIKERASQRAGITERIIKKQGTEKGITPEQDFQAAIKKSAGAKWWDDFAKNCVECGACNFTCCTCHCFLLADGLDKTGQPARVKQWDSCLYLNFARVAGNGNPRKHRSERLHNRFDKKFNFFPTVLKKYACDGCGRCAEACTGKIDIRDVLKRAVNEA
jgi:sulfhydrogenase subunit beta (sulfur reductase)